MTPKMGMAWLCVVILLAGAAALPPAQAQIPDGQTSPTAIQPDPLIQMMIDAATTEQIYQYDRELAGEIPVWVDDGWYTITTRYTYSGEPIQKAAHYIGQHLAGLGLDVEYHEWDNATNPNVIGELPGLVNPDDIYIIGGHLDAAYNTPGADDDASGSVGALIAADILSQYQWGCTLRFAFWTGEEQWMLGSEAYAHRSWQMGENIVGYLNLDMIAWNTLGSPPQIDLLYRPDMPPTLDLAELMADVVDAYGLNLIPDIYPDQGQGSDQEPFWDYGYTAILAIEDHNGDFNPYYHQPGDTPAHTDPAYFTDYVKAAIGTFAHFTDCLISSGIGALDGHVTEAGSGAAIEGAQVTAEDSVGRSFTMLTDATGYYTKTLLSDTYTVTAEAYGYAPVTVVGVEIITGTLTTVDIEMPALPVHTVSGYVRDAGTNAPLAATVQVLDAPIPPVSTDPATGFYSVEVAEGTWHLEATAVDHAPVTVEIVVTGDVTQDFELPPICDVFADDVEEGNLGWTVQSPWGITTEASHSPTHSWTDSPGGPYGNNRNVAITSAAFDLTGYTGMTLSFWHIYDTEPGYDYGYVEYSTNGGTTWTEAASYNGYDQETWMYEEIPLPALDGEANVKLRFRFYSDGLVTADGWHVDDIVLRGGGPGCLPPCTAVTDVELSVTTAPPIHPLDVVEFSVDVLPDGATLPLEYAVNGGAAQMAGTEPFTFSLAFEEPGEQTVTVEVWNCYGVPGVEDSVEVTVEEDLFHVYLPLIRK